MASYHRVFPQPDEDAPIPANGDRAAAAAAAAADADVAANAAIIADARLVTTVSASSSEPTVGSSSQGIASPLQMPSTPHAGYPATADDRAHQIATGERRQSPLRAAEQSQPRGRPDNWVGIVPSAPSTVIRPAPNRPNVTQDDVAMQRLVATAAAGGAPIPPVSRRQLPAAHTRPRPPYGDTDGGPSESGCGM